jgi:hypothetical protein
MNTYQEIFTSAKIERRGQAEVLGPGDAKAVAFMWLQQYIAALTSDQLTSSIFFSMTFHWPFFP